jgi:FAD-dependent urate hydroxylase
MTRTRTALIIGAGIAGPASAMALQKAGIDSVIYEAHSAGADGIGAFLTLGTNGIDALRLLGADKAALAAAFPTPEIVLRNSAGRRLGGSPTGRSLADGTTSHTLKRSDLYRALHDEASIRGVRIEHGKRLLSAEDKGDGVRAVFADGTEATGDVLIGCDGLHSAVRQIIDPSAPAPRYTGLITNGGYARGVPVTSRPGSYEMIFGRRGFFGYAMAPDGEVWWFANVPRPSEPARGVVESISDGEWRERLNDLFALDDGPAVPLIAATPAFAPMSPIHTIPYLRRWHNDRMIVIGDAAHAPSPTSGQGASLSIEDAVELAMCLRDLPTPQAAFSTFESRRRPRVEGIIKWAARINNSKVAGPVGSRFRDAMMPWFLRMTAGSKAYNRTYGYRIDWNETR